MRITRRLEFSASHRLRRPDWGDDRNRDAFGERGSRKERGHNYTLEVTVSGPTDPETGMLMDLKELKGVLEREVEGAILEYKLRIADWALPPAWLERVRLSPTEDLIVEVTR